MKKLSLILAVLLPLCAGAQDKYTFTEAADLNLVGKILAETPNPYHRVDTCKYKGFGRWENFQVRCSSGLAVAFETDSPSISVLTEYGKTYNAPHTSGISMRGYDLYIKKDGEWLWAGGGCNNDDKLGDNLVLVKGMDKSMKECLLYLPTYSEVYSVKIGVEEGAAIKAGETPFRHKIGVFGSSYTQGVSTGRAGMTWPAQFSRMTGLQLLSLGCSGNSKLQGYFANVLADADVDAFIFDSYSNPSLKQINKNLFPFIEKIQAKHPGKPLIFLQTIRRENRNFSLSSDKFEQDRIELADSLMSVAMKRYPDVYYVKATCATSKDHESTVDGIHPSDYGYTLWAESIRKPVLKILKKYGIR